MYTSLSKIGKRFDKTGREVASVLQEFGFLDEDGWPTDKAVACGIGQECGPWLLSTEWHLQGTTTLLEVAGWKRTDGVAAIDPLVREAVNVAVKTVIKASCGF